MDQTYLQQQAHMRLTAIEDRAKSMVRYVERCRKLIDRGLARDTEGMPAHEVVAQYAELTALNGNMIAAQADALAKQMRSIR